MANTLGIKLIRFYQKWITPNFFPSCRFHPSCSEYAAQALTVHSFWKALGFIILRLLKCHPYHQGGVDPVK